MSEDKYVIEANATATEWCVYPKAFGKQKGKVKRFQVEAEAIKAKAELESREKAVTKLADEAMESAKNVTEPCKPCAEKKAKRRANKKED